MFFLWQPFYDCIFLNVPYNCVMEINHNIVEFYDELYPVTEEQKVFYKNLSGKFKAPVKILSIGCGNGSFEHNLARQGSDVTGLETSQELLESANRRRRTQLMSLRFFQMSTLEMGRFLGKHFYNIISVPNGRLIYINHKTLLSKFFYDCRQLVSDDGVILIDIPNFLKYSGNTEIILPDRKSIRTVLHSKIITKNEQPLFFQELECSSGKKTITCDAPVYLPVKEEIECLAKENGFSNAEFFSDFSKNAFSKESDRLIALIS